MPGRIKLKAGVDMEEAFMACWRAAHPELPLPVRQFRFAAPDRQWRFDFAWPDERVAIEIDGGSFARPVICNNCHRPVQRLLKSGRMMTVREGGGHNTGEHAERDREKHNRAQVLGWCVLRFGTKDMKQPDRVAARVAAVVRALKGGAT